MTLTLKTLGAALITAGLMASAQAAPVSAVIDFSESGIGLGDPITDQYKKFGLEFTKNNVVSCSQQTVPKDPNCTAALRLAPPPPHSSPNFLMGGPVDSEGISFSIDVRNGFSLKSLTLDIAANTLPFSIKFFGVNNDEFVALRKEFQFGTDSQWSTQVLGDAMGELDSAVRRIGFGGVNNAFAIDFLRFSYVADSTNVPEPSGLGLVALALAGVGLSRRRKA